MLRRAGEAVGAAGRDDQPITFAPPMSPTFVFGPPPELGGVLVSVGAGDEIVEDPFVFGPPPTLEGMSELVGAGDELVDSPFASNELAREAGIVDDTVNVLAPLFVVVVLPGSLGGGDGEVLLLILLLVLNAGLPPIGELERRSASRLFLVSMNTPRGPATMSAWNWTVRSLSNGWFVLVMYT